MAKKECLELAARAKTAAPSAGAYAFACEVEAYARRHGRLSPGQWDALARMVAGEWHFGRKPAGARQKGSISKRRGNGNLPDLPLPGSERLAALAAKHST